MASIIPVRKGEELNVEKLMRFLQMALPDFPDGTLRIQQFSAGHSNLTYLLSNGEWEAVLRRPPLGPVAPKAHDMKREFEWLKEIHPLFPLAPKPLLFCGDESVIGSPFFLMERRKGIVLDTEFPSHINPTREICRNISETMIDTLVELHRLDYKKTRLAEMVKPAGFMERQVHGWIQRYERAKTDELKEVDALMKWLIQHIPATSEATVIHYDYKLNNALFAEDDVTNIVGLFDWEMTTVGDPLADVAVAMSYWIQDDDPPFLKNGLGKPPVTVFREFYTRDEFIQTYAEKSGRDVSHIHFYLTFAYFKLAVICQQIYYRFRRGQTNDERFRHFGQFVQSLIQYAWQLSLR
ncbi:phosphotransferase family protein [Thermaerobacillus caldiproteolyticus]|uniref:phosphotransferase family protein n=1 Tax=Thermaerobacillus caldiproteolyticus TaxID=247480 RepID=UPI00188B0C4A|nr:phosphotransferase family protein [Anoxybacillus caldiproteolyticus]QPA31865.1 phosphotransferase family protein [Anoxybacillus caldiproteolyticus]